MTEPEPDHLSSTEIGKDAVQSTVEAAASAVGEVATIVTNAVRDVATAVGGFMTEVFEIQEASKKAARSTAPGTPEVPGDRPPGD